MESSLTSTITTESDTPTYHTAISSQSEVIADVATNSENDKTNVDEPRLNRIVFGQGMMFTVA